MTLREAVARLSIGPRLADWSGLGRHRAQATWLPDGQSVVVKRWLVPDGADPLARLRAQTAAATALGLATPHVYWRGLAGDSIISVVRWETGDAPAVPLDPTGPVFRDLLRAVDLLHRQRLVHRDLCPRNVLVRPDGQVLLLDLEEVVKEGETGDVVGTPGFMPPEATTGTPAQPTADLYALGQFIHARALPVLTSLLTAPDPRWRAASVDEVRQVLPVPTDAPPFSGPVEGPERLHNVPGHATRLRSRPEGRRWLDRLYATGFGRRTTDGRCILHPSDLHRWQALLEPVGPLQELQDLVEQGAPGRVVWRLLVHLPHDTPMPVAWLDLLGAATLETHDPVVTRRVRAVLCHRSCEDPSVVEWWRQLLEAALCAHGHDSRTVLEAVASLPVPDRTPARRAHSVIHFRVALGVGPEAARAVHDALQAAPDPTDPDFTARLETWAGLLAYRTGQHEQACTKLGNAWRDRQHAQEAAMAASNLVAVWLHRDRPDEAEAVAREAQQLLQPGDHPVVSARLAAKLREAEYRAHVNPAPDIAMLEAISVASPPLVVALATMTEAAAAWRSGDLDLGGQLADAAAREFQSIGVRSGHLLSAALAFRCGHPRWLRRANRLEAAVDRFLGETWGPWLAAVAAQVLGLLAADASDPRAEDALGLAIESGCTLQTRREVMSLEEAGTGGSSLPTRDHRAPPSEPASPG